MEYLANFLKILLKLHLKVSQHNIRIFLFYLKQKTLLKRVTEFQVQGDLKPR